MSDALKLTAYFGESDRAGKRLLCDALLDLYADAGVRAAALLRGTEGFGSKQHRRTQHLLTLSEDLPLVAVAVDARAKMEALAPQVTALMGDGLVSLERARFATGDERPEEPTKLTVYLGRREPYGEAVEALRSAGVAGATVLLGVDGLLHGERKRARFFSRNDDVPLLLISMGAAETVERALGALRGLLTDPLFTLERIRVCKRDGVRLAEPEDTGEWQKLMVYAAEDAMCGDRPLYLELIRRLRLEGASGATCLRGIRGYSGDHAPHGDRLLSLRRRVPVVTTIVDRPERVQRWFAVVDELTSEHGLVTSELVPSAQLRSSA